ncbi:ATP-binding cassette domain-containing protein [Neorhizobium sp. T25_13]|uniref:branched-chain amino acid ABC transporter ATP-binding protein/permease n=1 Tax=Neorhizobium sp. T25_13 TaxID=2093830 RepID=UPI000CF8CA52|nr:branched-chain amino acid ABC transporter ATP-binding protein/permease [Neorhizobium sp. T25_13]
MKKLLTTAPLVAILVSLPYLGLADYYLSYLYIIFFWVVLATSWGILSGYTGYWSFGHAAFFGIGVYTTATLATQLSWPFVATIPAAALLAAAVAVLIGFVVFRSRSLRGEFFALLTLSVTFVIAAIVSNTSLDSGTGVFLSGIEIPMIGVTASGSLYMFGLVAALAALTTSYFISHSKFGQGLLAIHDDEDVAEVKGVPTFRYKLISFAVSSALAGGMGAIHAVYVGYVTVGETFAVTVPLYVVLMSILGGARHWAGPAIGAVIITVLQSAIVGGAHAEFGRAGVALALIVVILVLPSGIVPSIIRRVADRRDGIDALETVARAASSLQLAPPAAAGSSSILLKCEDVTKSFGGIRALTGVTLDVWQGEILALVGPNGSGKSTLINMISGHYSMTSGKITLEGEEISGRSPHLIAQKGVARTYQIPRLFNNLTVLENVQICAKFSRVAGMSAAEVDAATRGALAFTGLAEKADVLPASLNLHDRKFVEFARALAAKPRLLLLDEVLCGLNPSEVDHAVEMIKRIKAGGTTIIFVEHLMRAVVALADRVAVLDQGRVLALGHPGETMRDPAVISVYLGGSHAA